MVSKFVVFLDRSLFKSTFATKVLGLNKSKTLTSIQDIQNILVLLDERSNILYLAALIYPLLNKIVFLQTHSLL